MYGAAVVPDSGVGNTWQCLKLILHEFLSNGLTPSKLHIVISFLTHADHVAITSDALDFRRLRSPFSPTTFESAAFTVGSHNATVGVLLLYRPGSSAVTETFYSELTEYLEVFALYKCQIVIAGDFNIHVEKDGDPDATRLQDILASFDCTQHVPLTPTHRGGGTLDLVITKSEQTLTEMKVDPPDVISDHSLIR